MWLRIDDKMGSHPKVMAVSDAALGLWLRCATWAASHETDGHVPEVVIRQLSSGRSGLGRSRDALVRVGLWTECGDGICIHDFTEYNPSAAKLAEKRAGEAKRKAEWRDQQHRPEPW